MIYNFSNKAAEMIDNIVISDNASYKSEECIRVRFDPNQLDKYEYDGANFVYIPIDFHNGIIEVDLVGSLEENAPEFARGFVGIAYRISPDLSKFESIYIRPTNGRADDQVRRNHSTQYFSYPDYKFDRLRKEEPEKYESYCDIAPDEWIHIKISVDEEKACLYVNNSEQPVLLVNDMKHGSKMRGGVGLWIDNGTLAYFKNLSIIAS